MKIAFMGTPDFAVTCLDGLINSRHEVGLVVTQMDKAKDRGKKIQFTPVKEKALSNDIKVLQPEKVKNNDEFFEELKEYGPDIIVVVAYGQIIPKRILDLPKYGCINVHASLLPKLRGASPIQHAIITGEKETGVTIMQMGEGLDTGDMLTKVSCEIGKMNYEKLHDKLAELGSKLLVDTIDLIEEGNVVTVKQEDSLSSYAKLIFKQDGKIDFTKEPEVIERLIRGFDPWPGAFCSLNDVVFKFWNAEVKNDVTKGSQFGEILEVSKEGILIKCQNGALLVTEIQVPGKKRVKVEDYIRGNNIEVGSVFK